LDGGNPVAEASRPENGLRRELPAISLNMAKCELGSAIHQAIVRTGLPLKEFGDSSRVKRVCDGDVSEVIARLWQTEDRRKSFIEALAKASGLFDVHISISEKRSA
jgi:hypothetical protein